MKFCKFNKLKAMAAINDESISNKYKKEILELIYLTAKFNTEQASKNERDRLDELITANDNNMFLFEILSDADYKKSLEAVLRSL